MSPNISEKKKNGDLATYNQWYYIDDQSELNQSSMKAVIEVEYNMVLTFEVCQENFILQHFLKVVFSFLFFQSFTVIIA